ncbi:catalase, partial [Mycolicibacterium sphagni]|uniref:catalase n=1 Tax=Mycolicibacterium sphagni TaxID=1786 RepID=UPI0039767FAF
MFHPVFDGGRVPRVGRHRAGHPGIRRQVLHRRGQFSRGSADTVRDTRGFAVKFYTDEGN